MKRQRVSAEVTARVLQEYAMGRYYRGKAIIARHGIKRRNFEAMIARAIKLGTLPKYEGGA